MCVCTAYAQWWRLCHEKDMEYTGYVFRKRIGYDGVSARPVDAMVCGDAVQMFNASLNKPSLVKTF